MFCSQCGTENQPTALFCQKCGKALSARDAQPANLQSQGAQPSLWNPNAAANWSLVLTPTFGSYIQMLNWRSLGEPQKAAASQKWFYVSLAMLAMYCLIAVFIDDEKTANGLARGWAIIFLIVWYFSTGREQGKYVKAKFGKDYNRRPWGKALLIAVGALVGYFVAAVVLVGLVVGFPGSA